MRRACEERRFGPGGGLGLVAGLLLACGGGGAPAEAPERRPMAAPAPASARDSNRAPEIASVRIDPNDPVAGSTVRAAVDASDPDGDPVRLRYAWQVEGRTVGGDGPAIRIPSGAGTRGDRVTVGVMATDGLLQSQPVEAVARIANRAPEVLGVAIEPGGAVDPGSVLQAVTDVQDPDGDSVRLEYAWVVNDDEPVVGEVAFPTDGLQRGDHVRVRVVASDGEDESRPLESLPVGIGNAPPRIVSRPPAGFTNEAYRYELEVDDPDGDRNLRFELLEGPEGMRIDPVLGVVHWSPRLGQVGDYDVEVAVSDGKGATTAQRFQLAVRSEGGSEE